MSNKPNPVHARVGRERAKLAAWAHAARIVAREATFDSRGYSEVV